MTMRFVFDQFVLDCEQGVLWREGDLVALPPKVLETLSLLVQGGGQVVSKQEFMEALWPHSFVEDGNLTQNIFLLRKTLGCAPDGRAYIETVPKRGYRFVGATVQQEPVAPIAEAGEAEQFSAIPEGREAGSCEVSIPPSPAGEDADTGDSAQRRTRPIRLEGIAGAIGLLLLPALLIGGYLGLHSGSRMQVGEYQRLTSDGLSKDFRFTHASIIENRHTLYFNEIRGNQAVLAHVATGGGETVYDGQPSPESQAVGLDPRAEKLLFGSTWRVEDLPPLISKDLHSGVFTPVFNLHAQDASWSPDGRRLAYAQFGKLFIRAPDGSASLVASVDGQAYWPRWSPDGRVLRFTQNYDGYHDRLWEVDSTGANLHQLFAQQSGSDSMCCGSWTPSGRAFVYMSDVFHRSSIHVQPELVGGPWNRWLRSPPPPMEVPAAPLDSWEAAVPGSDGKHIYAIGEQMRGRLVRIDPLTRRPEPFLGGISAEGVSFSPDGAFMVWTAYPEGTLWRSRIDGTKRVQLSQGPLVARFPHWSPDGSTIVFIAAHPGSDWKLYTVSAQGGAVKPLLQQSAGQGVATWSPDGKSVAFGSLINVGETHTLPSTIELYRLGDAKPTALAGSIGMWTARWSPDGRFLSALTRDNQTLRLYDLQRGTWTDMAHGNINDVVWTPDSKYLFFDTALGAEPLLYRLRLSDQKVEAWANLENVRRAGFFAPWLGVAPDGAPILLEDASIQELYSISVNLP